MKPAEDFSWRAYIRSRHHRYQYIRGQTDQSRPMRSYALRIVAFRWVSGNSRNRSRRRGCYGWLLMETVKSTANWQVRVLESLTEWILL